MFMRARYEGQADKNQLSEKTGFKRLCFRTVPQIDTAVKGDIANIRAGLVINVVKIGTVNAKR